ncbi:N-acetylglucosamine kinase 1 [Vermiconidia calcicola]|uniref:N-acetylglucosamine kinase 1 n=1 Tax=Vermiconidia calcicola TaxID=1690605 RepID=A0ACC3NCE7_9PEZI|nr:N-acetylglucosamine kinase 1 [Vermiconidia calcicola]
MTSFARYYLQLVFDFWIRSRLRRAMSVVFPSLVQIVQPAYSNERQRVRDVAERTYEKSMETFANEVQAAFEAPVRVERLWNMSGKLQEEYKDKLRSSTISMLPSYQHTLPTGGERGDVLALDVGGSTFRAGLIQLRGKARDGDGLQVRRVRNFAIDERIRQLPGRQFFDWMASRIGEMLVEYNHMNGTTNARLQMGLAWSFPIEQTSPCTGRLLKMGKGFRAAHGVEGADLSELIMAACHARGLNVEICAIVNDGAATLLSQAYRDPATRMSLILGTGMNAAVFLPVSALGGDKYGKRSDNWYAAAERVVVNTELSMFGKQVLPTTKWDDDLNSNHRLPDFQPLEYLITGRYLGEILRLVMLEAISTTGLFNGQIPERLDEPYAFETRTLAIFESDRTTNLSDASAAFRSAHPMRSPPKLHELEFIRDVGRLASRRAAAYLATSLHALWAVRTSAEGIEPNEASHVTIACDGSMIEKYPDFRRCTQRFLDRLCVLSGASEGAVTLELAPESSIFGAAVAASCMAEGS